MLPRAEKEDAHSRVCAGSLMGRVEVVGSESFLNKHFCEHCNL